MNDNPRAIRPMTCSGSDEHDEMQLVMKSGEVLESKSVWHPIKCSHSGISCGTRTIVHRAVSITEDGKTEQFQDRH